jgi:ComF family protein
MRSVLNALRGLIYPGLCLSCGTNTDGTDATGDAFCGSCMLGFGQISGPCCSRCGRLFDSGTGPDRQCVDCIKTPPVYDTAYAPLKYEGPVVDAIHLFKYRGLRGAADIFRDRLRDAARDRFAGVTVVVPVPLHRRRLASRGFNQSLVLASIAAEAAGASLLPDGLIRTRHTRPQVELKPKERIGNVRGAFAARSLDVVKGESVLLIDDVYTTGATAKECAGVLRKAGASSVHVLTLARTLHS